MSLYMSRDVEGFGAGRSRSLKLRSKLADCEIYCFPAGLNDVVFFLLFFSVQL